MLSPDVSFFFRKWCGRYFLQARKCKYFSPGHKFLYAAYGNLLPGVDLFARPRPLARPGADCRGGEVGLNVKAVFSSDASRGGTCFPTRATTCSQIGRGHVCTTKRMIVGGGRLCFQDRELSVSLPALPRHGAGGPRPPLWELHGGGEAIGMVLVIGNLSGGQHHG